MILDGVLFAVITVIAVMLTGLVAQRQPREVRDIVWASLFLHIAFMFANLWVTKNIYGRGDMYAFHQEGVLIAGWMRAEPGLVWQVLARTVGLPSEFSHYGASEGTRTMVYITSILCYLTSDSFFAISYIPAVWGFFAKVGIFHALRDTLGKEHRRVVAVVILCIPTAVYWTAGMIKETIALCCMGIIAVGFSQIRRRFPIGLALVLVGGFWLQMIKGHFLLTGVLGFAIAFYWNRSTEGGTLSVRPLYLVLSVAAGVVGLLAVGEFVPRFALDNLVNEIKFLQVRRAGGSQIDLGVRANMGTMDLVRLAPLALFTGLYRPTILDVTSAPVLVNAIETTFLLVLTVRAVVVRGFKGMFAVVVRYPVVMFLLVFSTFSALGIGLATGNLGTMSRFRAPIMPMFALAVIVFNLRSLRMRRIETADERKLRLSGKKKKSSLPLRGVSR